MHGTINFSAVEWCAERSGDGCAAERVQHSRGFSTAWRRGVARLQHAASSQLTAGSIVRAHCICGICEEQGFCPTLINLAACALDRHHRSARPITNGQGRVAAQAATGPPRVVLVSTTAVVQPLEEDAVAGPWASHVDAGDDEAAAGAQAAEYLVRDFVEKSDMVSALFRPSLDWR